MAEEINPTSSALPPASSAPETEISQAAGDEKANDAPMEKNTSLATDEGTEDDNEGEANSSLLGCDN